MQEQVVYVLSKSYNSSYYHYKNYRQNINEAKINDLD